MAINPYSLKSKSLTPTDFEKLSLFSGASEREGEIKEEKVFVRRRSTSETENAKEREEVLKEFSRHDYIKVEHLTVEIAGEYVGFSAFFFALVSSAPSLVTRITRVTVEDQAVTKILKKAFFDSFVRPCLACHAQQLDQSRRCRILAQTFTPLLNYFYDYSARSDRLTQKTLQECTRPVHLPFRFQTPEQIPPGTSKEEIIRFFDFRDASINLRATDRASSLPTCIEYFEKYLARMELSIASIQQDLKVLFFRNQKDEEDIELFLTDAFFEELCDRQLHASKAPKFLMFIRDRSWKVDEDHYFVPSVNITARTETKQVSYVLKSVTYVKDARLMDYATLMMQPSGEGYQWSREAKTPSWEGSMEQALQELERLTERQDLSEEHLRRLRIDTGVIENTDCCIYELVEDF